MRASLVLAAACAIGCGGQAPAPRASTLSKVAARASAIAETPSAEIEPAAPRPGWVPAKTYALVVGVLTFADPKIASFSDRHRKDRELADALVARGVPADHVTVLLDRDATAGAVFEALEKVASAAPPGSTLLFYYAGHGDRREGGAVSFVPYDAAPKDAARALPLDRVRDVVAGHFAGETILLLADCCYSGGLADVATALRARGKRALSLTSAESSNTSTENWTFTQTLIDDLEGDPLADHDGDGTIALSEVVAEERDAMKARERQRAGASTEGFPEGFALATRSGPRAPADGAVGAYVEVERGAKGASVARVIAARGDRVDVQFYDYSDKDTETVPAAATRPVRFRSYAVGAELSVVWGGKRWPARVTRVDGDFSFITYPGWPSYWDEWILSDRVADDAAGGASFGGPRRKRTYASGDAVSVVWRGRYWDAHVTDVEGGRYLVRYDGYDASWDEWVPSVRMKPR